MLRSLSVRIVVLLTISLLPIGLVAVQQTSAVVKEARRIAERDILSRTFAAVGAQQALIRNAQGAAQALGAAARLIGPDSPRCTELMAGFVARHPAFVFAGYGSMDGMMTCVSTGTPVNLSSLDDWAEFANSPRPIVSVNRGGVATGQSVLITTVPIASDTGAVAGFASLSVPLALADMVLSLKIEDVDLALVDPSGSVLATSLGSEAAWIFERLGIVPSDLTLDRRGRVLSRQDRNGVPANIAVFPLIESNLYVVGKWRNAEVPFAGGLFSTTAPVFPVIMWLIGLVVAFLAIERLVLRHLRTLRRQMGRLSMETGAQSYALLDDAPSELAQIATSYNAMIDRISAEHAQLEEVSREKTLLLKEVHHRVKNNLQLIASILSMQLRHLEVPEAQHVLRRVQDRVMSLATIHRSLYADTSVEAVRADAILKEIINQVLNVGMPSEAPVDVQIDLGPVVVDPDQAVPLSLLVTEAVTNAMKYTGRQEGSAAILTVTLSEEANGVVDLVVRNSRGEIALQSEGVTHGTGLGSRLIEAFASQLGGQLQVHDTESEYVLHLVFTKLPAKMPEAEEPT